MRKKVVHSASTKLTSGVGNTAPETEQTPSKNGDSNAANSAAYTDAELRQFITQERAFLREKYLGTLPNPYSKLLSGSPEPWEDPKVSSLVHEFVEGSSQTEGISRLLIVTHAYPSMDNPYPNGFVHRRVKAYQKRGIDVSVVISNPKLPLEIREYDGVRVLSGDGSQMTALLKTTTYTAYFVHFPTRYLWTWIEPAETNFSRWVFFIHGFEARRWVRSLESFTSKEMVTRNIEATLYKQAFFRDILKLKEGPSTFVFVSNFVRACSELDMEIAFPDDRTQIIHNFIDTDLFNYVEKKPEDRLKILWMRSAATMSYAPDLAVEALKILKGSPWWSRLEIRIVGEGQHFHLFEDEFCDDSNVTISTGFLPQNDIPAVHKNYGLFLTPTRFDTQGVGRDEAMAGGLVPVTNKVSAIPEFLDDKCAVLAEANDARGLATGMIELFENENLFLEKSVAAARQVRELSGVGSTVERELNLMQTKSVF